MSEESVEIKGDVAWLGVPTVDFRTVLSIKVAKLPLPIIARGFDASWPPGWIRSVSFSRAGVLSIEGSLERITWQAMQQYGYIACGIDLDCTNADPMLNGAMTMSGTLMALTLYVDSEPAWPEARIVLA